MPLITTTVESTGFQRLYDHVQEIRGILQNNTLNLKSSVHECDDQFEN